MGRLGGRELGFGSDADVLFVCEPDGTEPAEATRRAHLIAERLRTLLAASSADPPLRLDADLRPEGRNGALVRSLDSYAEYYARWASVWEAQALLRARFAAGDAELAERFLALIEPTRYPAGGLDAGRVLEIRRIKGRVDAERLPRGADPNTHTKLGRGGLADVEWTVQLLQLRYRRPGGRTAGHRHPGRARPRRWRPNWSRPTRRPRWRRPGGSPAGPGTRSCWSGTGPTTSCPSRARRCRRSAGCSATAAGFEAGQLVDDYRRAARRARRVVEAVFYAGADLTWPPNQAGRVSLAQAGARRGSAGRSGASWKALRPDIRYCASTPSRNTAARPPRR